MLYNILYPLVEHISAFNLFRYITFRTGGAVVTSLLICFIAGPYIIAWLRKKQKEGQPLLEELATAHFVKKGTPTMGGLMILLSLVVSTLLWADVTNPYVWIVLMVTFSFGAVGFVDDYLKLTRQKNNRGLSGKTRLLIQFIVSAVAAYLLVKISGANGTALAFPFFKNFILNLGWLYIPFVMLVVVGSGNAVNLTDGLDGLATVPVMIAAACFGFIAYLVGNAIFSSYLGISHIPGTGELAVFCGALVGACLGFLWFNAPPAQVFMGDTGSLAMGSSLGIISAITKHEIVLAIIGGLFVLEAVSVIVQVASYKLTGKRVFRMAPLHHHFEKKGWKEPTIVIRFWIIAVILALIGLSTLKLR